MDDMEIYTPCRQPDERGNFNLSLQEHLLNKFSKKFQV